MYVITMYVLHVDPYTLTGSVCCYVIDVWISIRHGL